MVDTLRKLRAKDRQIFAFRVGDSWFTGPTPDARRTYGCSTWLMRAEKNRASRREDKFHEANNSYRRQRSPWRKEQQL